MKWPEHCSGCYPRRAGEQYKPTYFDPRTGRAWCKPCQEMPGFWRMFESRKTSVPLEIEEEPSAK